MVVQTKSMTLEEFLALPEEKPALEFIDGAVRQKVSPKGRHSTLQHVLDQRITQSAVAERPVNVFPELRVTFAGESKVPDLAVYRRERVPRDENGDVVDDFLEPPDIVVEIVSPEQGVNALVRKCLFYIAHGVQVALLVDPGDRSVVRFSTDGGPTALQAQDRIDLGEAVPDFRLTVEELFRSLRVE